MAAARLGRWVGTQESLVRLGRVERMRGKTVLGIERLGATTGLVSNVLDAGETRALKANSWPVAVAEAIMTTVHSET
jgi:hypothetical protein